LDALREIARAGDVLGGLGELRDRLAGRARGEEAEQERESNAGEDHAVVSAGAFSVVSARSTVVRAAVR
jgi:hypothetical protein